MSLNRILGVLLQEYYITKGAVEVIIDLFYFSIVTVVLFGFFSVFLMGQANPLGAQYLILGTLLWEIVRVTQYTVSVGSLWNIWSRNLSNMFVAPLSLKEYMFAHMLSGAIKALFIFIIISLIALYMYNFNIFKLGFTNLFLYFVNLTFFAWSIGIMVLGLIFRYGTRIQAFAWSVVFLFQPLCATLFPLSVLPPFLLPIALALPPTYIFEAARLAISNPAVNWKLIGIATLENAVYFTIALLVFKTLFNKSKETGQFARNEG